MIKALFWGWLVAAFFVFLYSFTQIDLSLTFSQASIWQGIQKSFQYIGFFNRPLSAILYIVLIGLLFGLYALTLSFISKKKIAAKGVVRIIFFVSVVLFFSYNAFSYDIFNYIFDAKIVTVYNQNPYEHKALDYPQDPMLSFMRWTHRTYPYGPVWLPITIPFSYIGMGIFSVTFYLFKLIALVSYLGSSYLIYKIASKLKGASPSFALAAFALNPLVLVESLVSAHNDIVMMFFGLLALYFFVEKKLLGSFLGLIISIGIKYATAMMVPALIAKGVFKVRDDAFIYILTASMVVPVVLASLRTNFQPWYLLFVLPYAAFIQNKYFVSIPVFIMSLFAMFQYIPFLYTGNWDPPIPMVLQTMTYGSILISILAIFYYKKFGHSKTA